MHIMRSLAVEGLDELDHVLLALVLDLLLLHPQVIVVLEVSVHDHLVQVPDYADVGVGLHIVVRPLLQLALTHVHLRLVHYLHEQTVVLIKAVELAPLGVLDQPQNVLTLLNDLLLLFSGHVSAQDLGNDLTVQHLLEFVDRVLMLGAIFGEKLVEFVLVGCLNAAASDLSLRSLDPLVLDLPQTFLQVGQVSSS